MMSTSVKEPNALALRLEHSDTPTTGWLAKARGHARERVTQMGLPTKRDEYWRYTDPLALSRKDAAEPERPAIVDTACFDGVDALHLIFVDGRFEPDLSDALAIEGVDISLLSDSQTADIHWARDLYGQLEHDGQKPVPRPFAALNTATAQQGLLIHVTGRVKKPILISHRHSRAQHVDEMLHHCLRLDAGASLTLLEDGLSGARMTQVIEADLGPGAALHHIRSQPPGYSAAVASYLFARLQNDAALKSFTLNAHRGMTRNETIVTLNGPKSMVHLSSAVLAAGPQTHQDDTVFITHNAEGCESRQVFKKVLENQATSVFQGKILVNQCAQKTDGYQISKSLLLDDGSQFLAKPELEIYADDVRCSHGSTSGAIDETALFYLRSRGVSKHEARDLLVLAFLAEALEEIEDAHLAHRVHEKLELWLEQRSAPYS